MRTCRYHYQIDTMVSAAASIDDGSYYSDEACCVVVDVLAEAYTFGKGSPSVDPFQVPLTSLLLVDSALLVAPYPMHWVRSDHSYHIHSSSYSPCSFVADVGDAVAYLPCRASSSCLVAWNHHDSVESIHCNLLLV